MKNYFWGWHVFNYVAKNPKRRVKKIFILEKFLKKIDDKYQNLIEIVDIKFLNRHTKDHQGIVFEADAVPFFSLKEFQNKYKKAKFLVAVDQIQDSRNLGAIVRTCAAFGVDGIVLTKMNCASLNGSFAKAAAGASEILPIVVISNLRNGLSEFQKQGFYVYALDERGDDNWSIREKSVLVLGQEGKGLRSLTKTASDFIIKIKTNEAFKVLNVSVAAGVAISKFCSK